MSAESRPNLPGFNDKFTVVEISPEDREIGRKTHYLFASELKRSPRWNINRKGEKIAAKIDVIGSNARVIDLDALAKERITPELARMIAVYKRIEDLLPDYMGRAVGMFRTNVGISESYNQWGNEELQHSLAAGLILEATGNKTATELYDEQLRALGKTWEMPFDTGRRMVIYAALQERNTHLAYRALARRAREEDASVTSEILELIAKDEAYHGSGYTRFARIYFEFDPEGTKQDALHVARNYRMPAQNLFPNKHRVLVDTKNVYEIPAKDGKPGKAGMDVMKDMLSEGTINDGLVALKFISPEEAKEVASSYWLHQESLKTK